MTGEHRLQHRMPDLVLSDSRIASPAGVVADGWLAVSGERIAGVGTGQPPAGVRVDTGGALIVPGFIDMHCHGGGGAAFSSTDPAEIATAIAAHRRHGTTTMLASLVSDAIPTLTAQLAALAELVCDDELLGVHLEGPFLARAHCGAHDPALLREPDRSTISTLLKAGDGQIRMVTLAPELPRGRAAVRQLSAAGVLVAIGHTAGTEQQIRAAIDAGATVATHLFNGMPPLHHRAPGPAGALLDDERITVELLADQLHVHPAVLRLAVRTAGPDRTVVVTDAMPAAGADDGRYRLGRLDVDVTGGVATLAGQGTLAGSTLTMDAAFRNLVTAVGLSIPEAVRATASRPAELLGIQHRTGTLCAGLDADLVVLDDDIRPIGVLRRGQWVVRPELAHSPGQSTWLPS